MKIRKKTPIDNDFFVPMRAQLVSRRMVRYTIEFPSGKKVVISKSHPTYITQSKQENDFILKECRGILLTHLRDTEFKKYMLDKVLPHISKTTSLEKVKQFIWKDEYEYQVLMNMLERGYAVRTKSGYKLIIENQSIVPVYPASGETLVPVIPLDKLNDWKTIKEVAKEKGLGGRFSKIVAIEYIKKNLAEGEYFPDNLNEIKYEVDPIQEAMKILKDAGYHISKDIPEHPIQEELQTSDVPSDMPENPKEHKSKPPKKNGDNQ